jgi:hypothetical protein
VPLLHLPAEMVCRCGVRTARIALGLLLLLAVTVAACPSAALAASAAPVAPLYVFGIPVDFILFGLTLLGVAVLHRHTLPVALIGLVAIVVYQLVFTGFKTGAGLNGFALHMRHEWVILANLFLLLTGFALLSRHFEESRLPDEMPALLPDDWMLRLKMSRHDEWRQRTISCRGVPLVGTSSTARSAAAPRRQAI